MIDLETGIMDIEGVVMTPDSKLEDFKKYDANLVGIDVWGKGWGIITIKKWIRSNGIDAGVKFRIDEGENSRQIIIEPTLINQSGMKLLDASKKWLKGMALGRYKETDNSIIGEYNWGSLIAHYVPDRDYGIVGGEIKIDYSKVNRTILK